MATTAEPPRAGRPGASQPEAPQAPEPAGAADRPTIRLDRAEGIELLGDVHGSGYKEGAALVRRADGQMVQLTPLMYAVLACVDGQRDARAVAAAVSERSGRQLGPEHVVRLAEKLAAQGLLAGSEQHAPPKRNPLLALRWKVLVTDPRWTNRLTAPLAVLFRPWIVAPVLVAFLYVAWFVLVHKGVASATAQAFHNPGLLVLVFALAVLSAGFHELGHAAACRYGGATPGGMGMGLYMIWPAFYTDVTDSYRLPRGGRLRVDLGGLYFNTVVASLTMAVWLLIHSDALLLLVALQILQMVKQLSPVIRADGYHILSDLTGVPDLYYQMGPTLARLLPGRRHTPSALSGRARAIVTVWVLVMVPILLSLSLSAVILLPHLATSAFDSGRAIVTAVPHQVSHGRVLSLIASLLRLLALCLPVIGSALVTQKILRTVITKARGWSAGSPPRQAVAVAAGVGVVALAAWAWWPAHQYSPVRANQNGTLGGLVRLVSDPTAVARPVATAPVVRLSPGTHLAVSMIPVGGASARHPALFLISQGRGRPAVAVVSAATPPVSRGVGQPATGAGLATATTATTATTDTLTTTSTVATTSTASAATATATATTSTGSPATANAIPATVFPYRLPHPATGPGDSAAEAVNSTDHGVLYDVAYSLVTVRGGAPVTNQNAAYAIASCQSCTTVAVSFQVVLVVGHSEYVAPANVAGALNDGCPACTTTALADQLVISLQHDPSAQLLRELDSDLAQLNALSSLGAAGTPAAVAAQVAQVQAAIESQLQASGDLTPVNRSSTATTATGTSTTATAPGSATTGTTNAIATHTATAASAGPPGTGTANSSASPAAAADTSATPTATATAPSPTATAVPSSTATTPAGTANGGAGGTSTGQSSTASGAGGATGTATSSASTTP